MVVIDLLYQHCIAVQQVLYSNKFVCRKTRGNEAASGGLLAYASTHSHTRAPLKHATATSNVANAFAAAQHINSCSPAPGQSAAAAAPCGTSPADMSRGACANRRYNTRCTMERAALMTEQMQPAQCRRHHLERHNFGSNGRHAAVHRRQRLGGAVVCLEVAYEHAGPSADCEFSTIRATKPQLVYRL